MSCHRSLRAPGLLRNFLALGRYRVEKTSSISAPESSDALEGSTSLDDLIDNRRRHASPPKIVGML
jgi:hypothetical protein